MIETVNDLKQRIYDQLGDDPIDQRLFDWSKILPLVADGIAYQRAAAGDVWDWSLVPAVALQGEYSYPANATRLKRVAWRDVTLQERSRMYLETVDWNWESRTGTPNEYTVDGFAQDKFRLYPKPTVSTQDAVEFRVDLNLSGVSSPGPNYGKITRMANVDFQVDPNLSPPSLLTDPDYGIMVGGFAFTGTKGKIVRFNPSLSDAITVWYIEKAPDIVTDYDPVPLHGPFRLGPMCYALWKVYDEDGDHHNGILSAFFRDWFFEIVGRSAKHAANPLPRIVHVLRPVGPVESVSRRGKYGKRLPDQMTDPDGNTWELLW